MPDLAKAARPDAIIATGRSDYPNQVNNVLVFPFIFRGALDVGATADQRADEARRGARARRSRQGRAVGHRRAGLRHPEPALRPRVPDPEAVRPAPHRDHRAGGGAGGDGFRRGGAADRRFRGLSRAADAVRLPLGPADEAGVPGGEEGAQADRVRRGRGRARAARGPGGSRRGARPSDPHRSPGGAGASASSATGCGYGPARTSR